MPNLLPTLFIVLGAGALVLTLYWLWQSLRQALMHFAEAQVAAAEPGSPVRASLLAEKQSLLVAIKDLEAERDTGKLSEADFVELNARYRARAKSVLKALDSQLAPHREAARELLSGATAQAAAPASKVSSAPVCPSCQATNDVDAAFCKKCGARLSESSEAKA